MEEERIYVWRCDGPCQYRQPFFGLYNRVNNLTHPTDDDVYWHENCNGNYIRIEEDCSKWDFVLHVTNCVRRNGQSGLQRNGSQLEPVPSVSENIDGNNNDLDLSDGTNDLSDSISELSGPQPDDDNQRTILSMEQKSRTDNSTTIPDNFFANFDPEFSLLRPIDRELIDSFLEWDEADEYAIVCTVCEKQVHEKEVVEHMKACIGLNITLDPIESNLYKINSLPFYKFLKD